MHEQENDLVQAKPDQKGDPSRDACMPYVKAVTLAPPLQYNAHNSHGNTEFRHCYHHRIKQGTATSGSVYPSCDDVIH
jgi:hypothetical protein